LADLFEDLSHAVAALSRRKKYLIGVSGGRDSMCLLHALRHLGFGHLVVCHLDHGLRGRASRADRNAAVNFAKTLGLTFEEARENVRDRAQRDSQSIELAARESRREFFTRCAKKHRCPRLFLAHHADDQVETVLFNFLRGTGLAGLGGMKPLSSQGILEIHRPLLGVTRAAIDEFARTHAVPFRDDASNLDPRHTRNRLRHEVLPLLRDVIGHPIAPALLRTSEIAREEEALLAAFVPEPDTTLSVKALHAMPLALQRRLVLRWLREQGIAEAGFEETALVLSLLGDGPAKINLPEGRHASRRSGVIFLA
jgi:tRNA(Ile)-lysidine synthase